MCESCEQCCDNCSCCECCDGKKLLCCSIIFGVISSIIIIIVLIAVSFAKLEAYEVGLEYNPNAVSINENKLYTEGIHFLGPGHYFIKFIRQQRTIQLGSSQQSQQKPDLKDESLVCRTKDALTVSIELSFQYQLSIDKDDLLTLYRNWGESYEKSFLLAARNTLRDVMAEFNALQVFYERSNIEAGMRLGLKEKLSQYKVNLISFQLLDIDLPAKFEQALVDTENLNLNVTTVTYQREQEVGKSQGRINKAKQDAEVIVNNANAYASRVIGEGLSKSGAIRAKITQQAPNLKALQTTLVLSSKQLAAYYFYD